MSTYVVGDIHGAWRALLQVIERSGIDREKDTLVCLGDVADGWSEVPECFDELLTFDNLIYVIGNHDIWFRDWSNRELDPADEKWLWLPQGGGATYNAYGGNPDNVPEGHRRLLNSAAPFCVDQINGNRVAFVHGGFPHYSMPALHDEDYLAWSREMAQDLTSRVEHYDHVYIGHTEHDFGLPLCVRQITNMDSGAGWSGVLSLECVDTREYWTSDNVLDLYPEEKGRR